AFAPVEEVGLAVQIGVVDVPAGDFAGVFGAAGAADAGLGGGRKGQAQAGVEGLVGGEGVAREVLVADEDKFRAALGEGLKGGVDEVPEQAGAGEQVAGL